jgi:membrane-bound ClpP family serine protease
MNKRTKKNIVEIILAFYKVPGEYAIGAMILFAIWNVMKDMTGWSIFILIFAIIFIFLEIISPIIAGKRLYDEALKNIKKILK